MTGEPDQDEGDLLWDAELVTALANAEKAQADAESARVAVEKQKLELLQEQINIEYQLSGIYTFHRKVDQKSMDKLFKAMRVWHQHAPAAPWTIYLNSIGGGIFAGNGIIDELVSHSIRGGGTHEVTIKVRGLAASMGSSIMQAADHRVMGANSQMMIHKCSSGAWGSADDIADEAEWCRNRVDWMINYFISRGCTLTRPEILRKINRKDWWLTAAEAVAYGLADRIG